MKKTQKIPFKEKVMKNNYLWGTRIKNKDAYFHILNKTDEFKFCFIRLFENEDEITLYRNIGVEKLLTLEEHLPLLKPLAKEKWEIYFQIYKEYKKKFLAKENTDEYEIRWRMD